MCWKCRSRRGIIEGMEIKAVIHEAEEGGYWAEVPALPGCFTQGDTLEEVKANVIEAALGWIEAQIKELVSYRVSRPRKSRKAEAALA